MIPKMERPTRMTELRPISLCNVGYKIISKVLCQRLKSCLLRLISETQSAFVPGRLISDNILTAHEMFHGLRANKACQNKYMAIKTDMSKAYDRVEWDFIQAPLQKNGFRSLLGQIDHRVYIICSISYFIKWSTARSYNSTQRLTPGGSLIYIFIHHVYRVIDCKH